MYDENDYERRFRMTQALFCRICDAIIGRGILVTSVDAAKKPEIYPRMRIIAALCVMAYGMKYDQADELCSMSESCARE